MSDYEIRPLDASTWDAFASATRSLFEEVGFGYERPKGKNCVMRTAVSSVEAS